ncbi:uncharacterized protein C1orf131-like [Littorina saxatilis]|uniref:Uncharacterized protein n=1 Tax=Littorina saxatilis TaxID=31220 RepID=A0AAN9AXU1_9CAEN
MATTKHVESKIDNNGRTREVEVFVFHNPAKRKKESKKEAGPSKAAKAGQPSKNSQKKAKSEKSDLTLESARHDVRNLGITGFAGRTRIEAELAQLKSLGAIIPKNWERKMDKKKRNEEFQRRRQDLKAGMKTKKVGDPSKSGSRLLADKEKKKGDDGVFFDGQVGTYKGGVQYISADDIKKVRSSAGKKR